MSPTKEIVVATFTVDEAEADLAALIARAVNGEEIVIVDPDGRCVRLERVEDEREP